jgi:hypothetical protein
MENEKKTKTRETDMKKWISDLPVVHKLAVVLISTFIAGFSMSSAIDYYMGDVPELALQNQEGLIAAAAERVELRQNMADILIEMRNLRLEWRLSICLAEQRNDARQDMNTCMSKPVTRFINP